MKFGYFLCLDMLRIIIVSCVYFYGDIHQKFGYIIIYIFSKMPQSAIKVLWPVIYMCMHVIHNITYCVLLSEVSSIFYKKLLVSKCSLVDVTYFAWNTVEHHLFEQVGTEANLDNRKSG